MRYISVSSHIIHIVWMAIYLRQFYLLMVACFSSSLISQFPLSNIRQEVFCSQWAKRYENRKMENAIFHVCLHVCIIWISMCELSKLGNEWWRKRAVLVCCLQMTIWQSCNNDTEIAVFIVENQVKVIGTDLVDHCWQMDSVVKSVKGMLMCYYIYVVDSSVLQVDRSRQFNLRY